MSLFVAQRKAEKFRHMIHSSLFNIVAPEQLQNNGIQLDVAAHHPGYTVHSCEAFVGNAGYGLALKDEVDTTRNSGRVRGTILSCDYEQGRLLKGGVIRFAPKWLAFTSSK